jgi:hypothetical protein
MILTNRLFTRKPASREAKSIYIFCEGVKREVQYFQYFREIDSRINIEIYPLTPHEDNSPLGLYRIAFNCLVKTDENPTPKYEFIDNDEAWIILDSDPDKLETRKPQIQSIREKCESYGWKIVQSNPCFEVWLHNHLFTELPSIQDIEKCKSWKTFISEKLCGGFDSRRHPILIENAIKYSKSSYAETENTPNIGSTQVYFLAEKIYELSKEQIDLIRKSIE